MVCFLYHLFLFHFREAHIKLIVQAMVPGQIDVNTLGPLGIKTVEPFLLLRVVRRIVKSWKGDGVPYVEGRG